MMSSLSRQLYDMIASYPEDHLDFTKAAHFFWIWYWLFVNQPPAVLNDQLAFIESRLEQGPLKANHILQLAWKAEALEKLLHVHRD
jgi:hypothetical protein